MYNVFIDNANEETDMNTKPMNIDNLVAEVKASGHSASATIGGSTYHVWVNKDGKTLIACGRNRISLKNARAAIAKATQA